jgi:hypothetical protein
MIMALFAALLLAYVEARKDANDIAQHIPIDHVIGWTTRAAFMGFVVAALVAFGVFTTLGEVVAVLIASAFLFSASFRYILNSMRGLHATYLSPSNLYDWAYLRPFMHPIDRTEAVEGWHVYMASYSALQAGRAAYITEGVITAACIVVYLCAP